MSESNYVKCLRCGKWGFEDKHTCPPAYGVRTEDMDQEEEVEVLSDSPEDAATKYAEDRFYDFGCPNEMTVVVNDWRDGRLYTYNITVEPQPVFYADLLSVM